MVTVKIAFLLEDRNEPNEKFMYNVLSFFFFKYKKVKYNPKTHTVQTPVKKNLKKKLSTFCMP